MGICKHIERSLLDTGFDGSRTPPNLPTVPSIAKPEHETVYTAVMICPKCGGEFREGFTHCASCDVDLVQPPPLEPEVELVKIYELGNAALIPVFESLLNDAAIEFMTKGEGIQDLFGWGRFGSNLNYVIGPVQFYVRSEDAADARTIADSFAADIVGLDHQGGGDGLTND